MAWFISQSILIIAAAFLLGIMVGWLIWGRMWRTKRASGSEAEGQAAVAEAPAVAVPAAAEAPGEPQPEPAADKVVVPATVGDSESEAEPAVAEVVASEASSEREPEAVSEAEPEAVSEAEPAVVSEAEPAVVSEAEPAVVSEAEPVTVSEANPAVVSEANPAVVSEAEPVAVGVTEAAGESVAAQAVAVAVADDLKRIEGIGPKMAGALADAGIRTYSHLASADEATLRDAIEAHGLKFAPSIVTWSRQAQLLADGDEEGFADLTRRLVAGRDEGRE